MSLGFIIAVVFAIVLLALAITWLQGVIVGIEQLTDNLQQEAQTILSNSLRKGESNFAIYPNQYDLQAGWKLKMSAGIANDAKDGKDHKFVINVIPSAADDSVLSAYGCSSFSSCTTLQGEMKNWATHDEVATVVTISQIGFKFIEISSPANAVKGTYLYNVVACYDEIIGSTPVSANCKEDSENIWGPSAQPLIITITS